MKKYYPLLGFIIIGLALSLVGPITTTKPTSMIHLATTQQLNRIIVSLKAKASENDMPMWEMGPVRTETLTEAKDSGEYTGTNTQVSGVDEADIIKTDGTYIYQLVDNNLKIFLADPASDAQLITTINLTATYDAYFSQLLLEGDQLILLGQSGYWGWGFYPLPIDDFQSDEDLDEPTTDQGEADESASDEANKTSIDDARIMPIFDRPITQHLLILDVSNKNSPSLIKRFDIEGSSLAFRKVNNQLVLVSQKYNGHLLYRTELATYNDLLPNRKVDDQEVEASIEEIVIVDQPDNLDMMSVTVISLADYSMNDTHLMGAGQTVLLTPDRLFIAQTTYVESNVSSMQTTFYQLTYQNGLELLNSVSVDGYMINSFAMDYYQNHLRTALTISNWNNNEFTSANRIVIFNSNLQQVSSIENLAYDETIYSARFVGNRGYIVTFKQVDPFFVFDLSDPSNPKVLGELKIPGFSTYLHPVSDNLVFGFGREVDLVNSEFGEVLRIGAMKLSLFDVSLGTDPKEVAIMSFGSANAYSDVLYDHKALMVYPSRNLYGFGVAEWFYDEGTYQSSYNNRAMIVEVVNDQFVTRLDFEIPGFEAERYDYIQRVLMIEDTVFIVTYQHIYVVDFLSQTLITRLS